jgi:hypothetical protein
MTSTFLQMQSRIADDLDRTDLNTQIKLAINRAIQHYEIEPFWFKETSSSFPAVMNQEEYVYGVGSVPTDVQMIDIMERQYSGDKIPMREITAFELEAKQSLDDTGIPDEFAQYQNRLLQFQESKLDVIKKRIALVAFLENIDENRTAILNETISPASSFKNELAPFRSGSELFLLLDTHPELALYANKGESLRIEEKWKTEKLKPKLNVEYHFLNKDFSEDLPSYFSTNNYRWGAEFSMPLLLREARGDLKVQRLKIEENNLNAEWKRKQLEQKTLAIDVAYSNTLSQQLLANNNSILYQRLLQAENTRLFNGESTLFIVNQRENTYFENAIKALELDQKVQQVKIDQSALWVLNFLN